MKQSLDETQTDISGLAKDVFGRYNDPERLTKLEASEDAFDGELWAELARSGLLGVVISEERGGLGLGVVEAALVLEAAGATTPLVPLAETLTAAWLIGRHGSPGQQDEWLPKIASGDAVVAFAPEASVIGVSANESERLVTLSGEMVGVPWAHLANATVAVLGDEALLIERLSERMSGSPGPTTARVKAVDLSFRSTLVERLDSAPAAIDAIACWRTLLAALQAGVADGAVRMTAAYTSQREQFGKPLSTFQGVALRAADAYIDARAIRSVARQSAWTLDEGGDAETAALTAAWWAAEAGQRVVHSAQHLHGGMGADITYPVHRYFLWGKQIELVLGGASALLAELGDLVVP